MKHLQIVVSASAKPAPHNTAITVCYMTCSDTGANVGDWFHVSFDENLYLALYISFLLHSCIDGLPITFDDIVRNQLKSYANIYFSFFTWIEQDLYPRWRSALVFLSNMNKVQKILKEFDLKKYVQKSEIRNQKFVYLTHL